MPVERASGTPVATRLSSAQHAALWCLRGYKLLLSPLFAGSCRFLPSCSEYAREAVVQHGVLKGSWLAARRLARCHPLGGSGLDPVPFTPAHDERAPASTATRRTRAAVISVAHSGAAGRQPGDLVDSPRV